MTAGDELRKIGTDPENASGGGRTGPAGLPILEPERHRTWSTLDPHRPRDRNQFDRATRLRLVLLSMSGGVLGFILGLFGAFTFGDAPFAKAYPFFGAAAGWLLVMAIAGAVSSGTGRLFQQIYMPSRAGERRREYSLAESFVARGRYEDAVSAFEMAVAEHPEDPVPGLRIARICRDHLDDPERAIGWFRRARDAAGMEEAQWRVVTRELIELHRRAGEPARAAPELARLAQTYPDSTEGQWAARELAEVKAMIAEERNRERGVQ